MQEEWKDVVGYEGFYQVSSAGRIRGVERTVVRKNGYPLKIHQKIRICSLDNKGYLRIRLTSPLSAKTCKVHRLVGEAFLENSQNKPQINHIDGNNLIQTLSLIHISEPTRPY